MPRLFGLSAVETGLTEDADVGGGVVFGVALDSIGLDGPYRCGAEGDLVKPAFPAVELEDVTGCGILDFDVMFSERDRGCPGAAEGAGAN